VEQNLIDLALPFLKVEVEQKPSGGGVYPTFSIFVSFFYLIFFVFF
jgi:hypothetical protein